MARTDARLREMAKERGQEWSPQCSRKPWLLDSVVDIAGPDIAEDRRRLDLLSSRRGPPVPLMT